ncbi:HlyD family efflux transporter periplasmic adaptor subunit [Dactylosporangium sp. CA-092794]|uniref:HlyD family efflux transporter periplasmic adaptor subunit n=1 Tax=Dactylosporangium sp. CA-092794 TaxID=3239929 RepID=UPI003D8B12E5
MRFRKQALSHLEKPEELDEVVRLATVPGWLLTIALTLAVAATATWAVVGTVERKVDAAGVLIHVDGVSGLDAVAGGQVTKMWASPTQRVTKGTPMYSTATPDGQVTTTTAPWDAYVVSVLVTEGQLLQPGTRVADLERLDGPDDALHAALFVPATAAPLLRQAMSVDVVAAAVTPNVFGTLHGTISQIGGFPETEESLRAFLGSGYDVRSLLAAGSVVRVMVRLDTDLASPTGLRWSKAPPPFQLHSVSQVSAQFVVSVEHPVDWLLS